MLGKSVHVCMCMCLVNLFMSADVDFSIGIIEPSLLMNAK